MTYFTREYEMYVYNKCKFIFIKGENVFDIQNEFFDR